MSRFRVLELFCGIGGCAAALGPAARVAGAIDINRRALAVYRRNFPGHPASARTLESLSAAELAGYRADLWWLSPPCQPFTRRGLGRDDEDPRSKGLLALARRIEEVAPRHVALENVPGFAGSRCHRRLREALDRRGYRVRERLLCPSQLGLPNRRLRFYLVAAREEPAGRDGPAGCDAATASYVPELRPRRPLATFLDGNPDPDLTVPTDLLRRYEGALDLVTADDPEAVTACFTAAYGRSPVRSGSYLRYPAGGGADERPAFGQPASGVRRFSPAEVLRLLGFPSRFTLPPELPREIAWRLVGNSLSLPPVRQVLAGIPELAGLAATAGPEIALGSSLG